MSLPEVETTILDGALGLSQQDLSAISAAIGVSSTGGINTFDLYSRPRDVTAALGTGPLVEKGAFHIARSRKPAYLGRVNASVAGTIGTVTQSDVASPLIVATGSPLDTYQVIIEITQPTVIGNVSASGAFRYSVDGGDSYSPEIAAPAGGTSTAAIVTGTGDLSAGGLYGGGGTLAGLNLTIAFNNAAPVTCTFVAPGNKAAVLSQLNAAFGGTHFTAPGNFLVINSTTLGIAGEIDITGGTALTALGLTVSTTNGTSPAGTYVLSTTGVTLAFPQGTYTDSYAYSFETTEPNYSLSDLGDILDVFLADAQKQWFVMHVVGAAADATAARAMADLLATYAADAEALHRFTWFAMETPAGASKASLKTAFATFESTRVTVAYGYEELQSEATRDLSKRVYTRSSLWPFIARAAAISLSEKVAFVGRGKLEGVVSVDQAILDNAEEMSDARFLALREVIGKNGYFVAEDSVMAPVGSDFAIGPYRRIMDVACRVTRLALLNYLQGPLLVNPSTGFIAESVAQGIEADVDSRLRAELVSPGHASDARCVVTRDENILSLQRFSVETRVTPPGYARTIVHTIGFINPTVT